MLKREREINALGKPIFNLPFFVKKITWNLKILDGYLNEFFFFFLFICSLYLRNLPFRFIFLSFGIITFLKKNTSRLFIKKSVTYSMSNVSDVAYSLLSISAALGFLEKYRCQTLCFPTAFNKFCCRTARKFTN